jgi:ABC-type Zn uptake system ZnuABC Zn-binding protein ZnuA
MTTNPPPTLTSSPPRNWAIINGVGYDAWAIKLADANKSSTVPVMTAGDVAGAKDGDNPHRWYNPTTCVS